MTQNFLMPTYARQPIAFSKGAGVWLTDLDGKQYLDAISGIGVCNLGHAHPAVTRALCEQAGQLLHTSNLYHIPSQEALAELLCHIADMQKVFFCNSGAEANEAAIKLARLYGHQAGMDSPRIIVMESAFHGRTLATLSATGNRRAQAGFDPLVSGFLRVPWNDLDAIEELATQHHDIAAVLVEPVQGEGGVRFPHDNFLTSLRTLCDKQKWLLMLDEVQSGNGRTGHYFACQSSAVRPDVITTAKGLGNGFPIGACLARGAAAHVFGPGNHGSTFGGNPLGCAVALAVVREIARPDFLQAVREKGDQLMALLSEKLEQHPRVQSIRGRGLMCGIVLDCDCADLVPIAREEGLLVNVTAGNVIRLLPPLMISHDEIQTLTHRLTLAIDTFTAQQEAL